MNTLKIVKDDVAENDIANNTLKKIGKANSSPYLLLLVLVLLWPLLQDWLMAADPTIGYIDPSIWLLVLMALICFFIISGLCWWLLQQFWMAMGLPLLSTMVSQFKLLALWQQIGFYWLAFASLLFAAVGILAAIC